MLVAVIANYPNGNVCDGGCAEVVITKENKSFRMPDAYGRKMAMSDCRELIVTKLFAV